jgi:hypothetical protein
MEMPSPLVEGEFVLMSQKWKGLEISPPLQTT